MKNWTAGEWILFVLAIGLIVAINMIVAGVVFKGSNVPNEGATQIRIAVIGLMNNIAGVLGAKIIFKPKSEI